MNKLNLFFKVKDISNEENKETGMNIVHLPVDIKEYPAQIRHVKLGKMLELIFLKTFRLYVLHIGGK